ncbi:MAG: imidazolonepropionase [Gemmatimonas sp. SG8_23]|jgi:imidazolonepropionase|nr:MAG: imidazolonepropionase [Gemmatimonas sp. SG8_23]
MPDTPDLVVRNGHIATMVPTASDPWGVVHDGLVAVRGEDIVWAGPEREAPEELRAAGAPSVDAAGGWITPGLIDAHTHIVFGGTRAAEFERRLEGATYEEIARAGGGILSTVRATRGAARDALIATAHRRMEVLVDHGCTTIEVKSGYGLDVETELGMLDVAREAGRRAGVSVSTTLLGAHAIPQEFEGDRSGYVDLVCNEMIPEAARRGLAEAVDAFCEAIAFTPSECRRVLETGIAHGMQARLHADQLSDSGGAALAAEVGARSADHLECTSEQGVRAMAEAGTAAVLLPGAFHFLGETRKPPVQALRDAGVPMVVATDLNPGSSPLGSPLLAMHFACTLYGLTPVEALAGMTREAARVLALPDRGRVGEGMRADLACWDVESLAELPYWMGFNTCTAVVSGGVRVR